MLTNSISRMIMDEEELHLLCGKTLSERNTVTVTRGLSTIINSSTWQKKWNIPDVGRTIIYLRSPGLP